MAESEMPIFTRTFDFLTWLLPLTNHFPRAQRFTVTQRLLNAAFDLRENLEIANSRRGSERLKYLQIADENLGCVRLYLRLAARGKRSKPSVAAFEFDLEPNLFQLQTELCEGEYLPVHQ